MSEPELWACDPSARTLRVELPRQGTLILPLSTFQFAEAKFGLDEIRAAFVSHEITIRGRNLRRILAAIARKELSFIALSPPAQTAPEGQPFIREITVKELKTREPAALGDQAATPG